MGHFWAMVLIASFLCIPSAWAETTPILIGVLEQPQCKGDVKMAVRVLFAKRGGKWLTLQSAESSSGLDFSSIVWTVAFDGRRIGSLKTIDPGFRSPYASTYSRDRLLNIPPGQSVPTVADDQERFAGWCSQPQLRPLVVVSRPNFRDPAGWKRFRSDSAYKRILFDNFKAVAGAALVCPQDPESPLPFEYGVKDLVLPRSYENRRGQKLIALELNAKTNTCDGPTETPWLSHWFLVERDTAYLGKQLELVDAGDYDSDGTSELIFWHSGYNVDGYTLFYDNFQRRVDYYWNYH